MILPHARRQPALEAPEQLAEATIAVAVGPVARYSSKMPRLRYWRSCCVGVAAMRRTAQASRSWQNHRDGTLVSRHNCVDVDNVRATFGGLTSVPVHSFETPICAYAAMSVGPI